MCVFCLDLYPKQRGERCRDHVISLITKEKETSLTGLNVCAPSLCVSVCVECLCVCPLASVPDVEWYLLRHLGSVAALKSWSASAFAA